MELTRTESGIYARIADRARSMAGWLKFVGVVLIMSAVPSVLTVFGIVFAWLPVWMGVLLIQAGNAAQRGSDTELLRMIEKLRLYFVIQGILIVLSIIVFALFFALFGTLIIEMIEDVGRQGPTWEA